MRNYKSNARIERVGQHWQATSADVSGDVKIGDDCSFWFQVTVRGDVAPITLGARVNVQEQSCLHCDSGEPLEIGDDVTIGHGAIVHGAKIGNRVLIGMGAIILGKVVIGDDCVVAAGAVVSPGTVVPDGMVIMGVPGKVVRAVRDKEREHTLWNAGHYVGLAREHVEKPEKFYR